MSLGGLPFACVNLLEFYRSMPRWRAQHRSAKSSVAVQKYSIFVAKLTSSFAKS